MKFYSLLIFILFLLINLHCEGAKFLFTFFHDNGSHFGSMRPLMEMFVYILMIYYFTFFNCVF